MREKIRIFFFMTNNDGMLHHYSLEEGRDDTHELPKDITEFRNVLSNGCHGLFLLYGKERNHVYNPATRELITLPEASQHIPFYNVPNQNVGLGYNHVAKEYKIVRFFNSQYSYKTEFHMECEIFTLGVSDSWRRVGSIPYPLVIFRPVFVNDSLYWMIESRLLMNRSALIISVNLRDEKISIIPHPCFCSDPNKNCIYMWLERLGGCLSLLDKTTVPLLDIWMLKDCTKPIWIKAYSINMLTIGFYGNTLCNVIPYVIPVAILSNGNILISIDSQLSEYDPRSKTITNYEGGCKYPYEGGCKYPLLVLDTYTESLVPLRRR